MGKMSYRFVNMIVAAVYALLFYYIFLNYVAVYFGRMNSRDYCPLSQVQLICYLLLCSIPFYFYSGLKTIASALSLFTFLLAYVPIINSFFGFHFPAYITIPYSIVLFFSMIFFFITDDRFFLRHWFEHTKRIFNIKVLELFVWACFVFVVILNYRQIRFVNFFEDSADLYDLRASNTIKGIYLLCWLRSAFFPFLMVLYLKRKSYIKFIFSLLAFVVFFMLDKQKLTFFFPLILFGLYHLVTIYKKVVIKFFHLFLIVLLLGISLLFMANLDNPFVFELAPIFIMRTLCIEAMELERYIDFFVVQSNPFTLFSHVGIVNFFTDYYPYPDTMGRMVSMNGGCANATFWLMDGVGGGGIVGCIIISVLFVIFKSMMNTISTRFNWLLCVIMMLFGIMSMLNLSLFISINSSGFIIIYLIFLFVKVDDC